MEFSGAAVHENGQGGHVGGIFVDGIQISGVRRQVVQLLPEGLLGLLPGGKFHLGPVAEIICHGRCLIIVAQHLPGLVPV